VHYYYRVYSRLSSDVEIDIVEVVNSWSPWSLSLWWSLSLHVVILHLRAISLAYFSDVDCDLAGLPAVLLPGKGREISEESYAAAPRFDKRLHIVRSVQLAIVLCFDEERCEHADQRQNQQRSRCHRRLGSIYGRGLATVKEASRRRGRLSRTGDSL